MPALTTSKAIYTVKVIFRHGNVVRAAPQNFVPNLRLRSGFYGCFSQRDACHAQRDPSVFVSASPEITEEDAAARSARPVIWELDFCSRPILDERKKKLWELLITDADRSFEHTEYFPNNKINSVQLREAVSRVIEQHGRPDKVRFFRQQMQTIITRALGELTIKAVPSKRCTTLMNWLEERIAPEGVYKKHPGYDPTAMPPPPPDKGPPEELPDALRGEQWAFVQLPLSALCEEAELVRRGAMFGDVFDLESIGAGPLRTLPGSVLVPGVAVFSRRAMPLAAWTNGLELGALRAERSRSCLVLETGVSRRWRYAAYQRAERADIEAEAWEKAKEGVHGLHFLAVQESPDAEPTGLWMMMGRELPAV